MSGCETHIADSQELLVWDQWINESQQGQIYHQVDWLNAIAQESGAKLLPLVCKERNQVVGVFPVFVQRRGLTAVFSPPPRCLVPELGPVFLFSPKTQSDYEALYFSSVRCFTSFIQSNVKPNLVRIKTTTAIKDARPFLWAGFSLTPRYTYEIPLQASLEDIFLNLKPQIRTDIRRAQKYREIKMVDGDLKIYKSVCEMIRNRYREQNSAWEVSDSYLERLYILYGGNHLLTKAILHEDKVIAGLILIRYKQKIYHWLGGVHPKTGFIGLNELLHWTVIQEASAQGYHSYGLVGANTEHLCYHKSKFNPKLEQYFELQNAGILSRAILCVLQSPVARAFRSIYNQRF